MGQRFQLPERETQTLTFLVHKHLDMAHLALWRNIDDPDVVRVYLGESV